MKIVILLFGCCVGMLILSILDSIYTKDKPTCTCKKCKCQKRHYKVHSIYSLTPAPWGDSYRFVESFELYEDAVSVFNALQKVNILFKCYKIVEETRYL
jgi:hypothetical protein